MGLDVYVGPLSRYYTGDWETIMQRSGRLLGMQVDIVRPAAPPRGPLSKVRGFFRRRPDYARAVVRWQEELSQHFSTPVRWDDSPSGEYFTDKPAWDCFGALMLWAAYEARGATSLPPTTGNWIRDPVFEVAEFDPTSKYSHLFRRTEIWLPVDLPHPVKVMSLLGQPVMVGSVDRLALQLLALNEATWAASEEDLAHWRRDAPAAGAPLESSARFGFSILLQMTQLAETHALPMKLDY